MPKYLIFIFIGFFSLQIFGQKTYDFTNPVDIPIYLSGNFGELRSNHFHAGIDIKTGGKEGLKVYAIEDGFVYRIKITRGGYGKALYIKHPNGLLSVYGHLKYFNDEIEAYIKQKQYEKKSFEIEMFPYKIELPVKKGEVIAYSGNTGGSFGPHLHFELRNMQEHPLNPMAYGIDIADHKHPIIQNIFAYPLGKNTQVNQSEKQVKLSLSKKNDSLYVSDSITAFGEIGIGLQAFDRQDFSWNKNGLYKVRMTINGLPVYEHIMQEFSFAKSHFINTMIDYPYYSSTHKRVIKLWVEPYNLLEIYTQLVNDGKIKIDAYKNYYINLQLSDYAGNTTQVIIPILGKKLKVLVPKKIQKTSHLISAGKNQSLVFDKFKLSFGKYSLYKDLYLKAKTLSDGIFINLKGVPIHKSIQIKYALKNIPAKLRTYAFIGKLNKKGKLRYTYSRKSKDSLIAYTKISGTYKIGFDSIPPIIKPLNFVAKDHLNNYRWLKLKIWDKNTGIKSYNGYIDGQWILLEYNQKKSMITYDFSDRKLKGYKHKLKIVVKDLLENTTTYQTDFYKK